MESVVAELPLYLQMSRYTKGSKAVMELRIERYQAEQAAATAKTESHDDNLITGSLPTEGTGKETPVETDDDGFSFDDFLDMINPLQHLPIVSTLYREMTGDQMEPAARIVGGAIYGGPIGAGISVAEAVLEQVTGDDLGGHVMSMFQSSGTPPRMTAATSRDGVQPAAQSTPITADAPAAQASAPLPSLSADAFNALLTSPEEANPARPAQQHATTEYEQSDVAAAMAMALDRYSVLKLVNEPAY
ncbi:MAG: hypothetical protein CMI60_00285 [Parvibaculum sp.]|jgi:hypothetical protein|nr:hypothetical protein [Parvibaculum sp.]|tara:strand:- start:987 stop:1724 length:738 start_codon:yes stop_codon:yes gene_type:complete